MKLPKQIKKALCIFEKNHFECYVVGGAVRDFLLGKEPTDYDLATNALPEDVKKVFSAYSVIETGLKHGTVTLIIEHMHIEITTYRSEKGFIDHRYPSQITFVTSLKEDLARRDFTINALAYHNELIDYFQGENDLKNRLIRTVGNSDQRFQEDGLRILRAIRFSAILGFSLEEETKQSVFKNKELLYHLSNERIRNEFTKILCGEYAVNCLLEYREIIVIFIPEITEMFEFNQKSKYHKFDLYNHTLRTVGNVKKAPNLRLAAFFHDIGKMSTMTIDSQGEGHFYGHAEISAQITEKILKRLKYSNKEISQILVLIRNHMIPVEPNKKQIKKCIQKLSMETLKELLELQRADKSDDYDSKQIYDAKIALIDEVIQENTVFQIKDLMINGYDILSLGFSKGPVIRRILEDLLEEVLHGRILNEKEEMLNYIKKNEKKYL